MSCQKIHYLKVGVSNRLDIGDRLTGLGGLKDDTVTSGTADSGTTTTMVDAARTEATVDYWEGLPIVFTSGAIAGQSRMITAFDPTTDKITFTPATTEAVSTQAYDILGTWLNSETITFEVRDAAGVAAVTNGTGSFTYITGSNGRYKAYTSANMAIVAGTKYQIWVLDTGILKEILDAVAIKGDN